MEDDLLFWGNYLISIYGTIFVFGYLGAYDSQYGIEAIVWVILAMKFKLPAKELIFSHEGTSEWVCMRIKTRSEDSTKSMRTPSKCLAIELFYRS